MEWGLLKVRLRMVSGAHRLFFTALLNSLDYTFQNMMQLPHNRAKTRFQTHSTAVSDLVGIWRIFCYHKLVIYKIQRHCMELSLYR